MNTDFGLRPYRVFSVVYRWTGGAIGRGEMKLASERELLPTPKVKDISVRHEAQDAGYVERGDVQLREVSPRYTEDDINALFHQSPLPPGFQGFVEMFIDARDGKTERRRFSVRGVPIRDAAKFEWSVQLIRQDAQRDRDKQVIPIDRGDGAFRTKRY